MTFAELRLDVVILCCAVSAGIHAALVPAHFEEGTGPGVGFILASLAPAACAVLLTRSPSRLALAATATVFGALIVSYLLVLAFGLPLLHPEREPVEALAVWTKVIEATGLFVAVGCLRRPAAVLADGAVAT
jgi:CHASE2 domain-containing sensor protein